MKLYSLRPFIQLLTSAYSSTELSLAYFLDPRNDLFVPTATLNCLNHSLPVVPNIHSPHWSPCPADLADSTMVLRRQF